MKTDHHALLINCADTIPNGLAPPRRRKVNFYDLRKPNIDALAQALNTLDWSCVTDLSDVDLAYVMINSSLLLQTLLTQTFLLEL